MNDKSDASAFSGGTCVPDAKRPAGAPEVLRISVRETRFDAKGIGSSHDSVLGYSRTFFVGALSARTASDLR